MTWRMRFRAPKPAAPAKRRLRLLLAAGLALGWPLAAGADPGAPLSLLPSAPGPAAVAPSQPAGPLPHPVSPLLPSLAVPAQPAAPETPEAPEPPEVPVPASPGGQAQIAPRPGEAGTSVELGALAAPDPSSLGLLAPGHGGLALTLWQGTSRASAERLLSLLPASPSPAAQRLTRRLLLSVAAVPAGPPVGPSLLAIRIQRLIAIGDSQDAAALAALAPPGLSNAAFNRAAADADWLSGKPEAACAQTTIALTQGEEPYWDMAGAFCRAGAHEQAEARLTLDLLRDEGKADPAGLALLGIIAGEPGAALRSLKDPSALDLAMLQASHRPPPADVLEGANPSTLAFIAALKKAPLDMRLAAAARAVTLGASPPADLAALYETIRASRPPARAAGGHGAKAAVPRDNTADALLYQQIARHAARTGAPATLIKHLQQAATPLYRDGGLAPLLRTLGPTIAGLTPEPSLLPLAPTAARILLALGQITQARGWLQLEQNAALGGDPAAKAAAARLWALFELADPAAPPQIRPEDLRAWWNAGSGDEAEHDRQAGLLYALFDALGHPVPAAFWSHLYAPSLTYDSAVPNPAILRGLQAATAAGRNGETLTFALLALGEGGTAAADGTTLAAVITALERIDLAGEAHNLALEAALAHGL